MNRKIPRVIVLVSALGMVALISSQSLYGLTMVTRTTTTKTQTNVGRLTPPPVSPDPRTQYRP